MNKGMTALLAAAALVVGACNGWPTTEGYAYPDAVRMPEKYPTYTPTAAEDAQMFLAGNHRYMVMPGMVDLRSAKTAQVGTAGSASVFSVQGDEAPFSNLFARAQNGQWRAVGVID